MNSVIRVVGLLAMAATLTGCGGGENTNALPPGTGSPEYAKKTGDMMKGMYGMPKAEKAASTNPADMMRKTYGK